MREPVVTSCVTVRRLASIRANCRAYRISAARPTDLAWTWLQYTLFVTYHIC